MLHTPIKPNYIYHEQLLGCISKDRAHCFPKMPIAKGKIADLHIWLDTSIPAHASRMPQQRPMYFYTTFHDHLPTPKSVATSPQVIPGCMHEIVLLFINADDNDPYCGHPFLKTLNLDKVTATPDPDDSAAISPSQFYYFMVGNQSDIGNIFNNLQRELLRQTAIRIGCPPEMLTQIPFAEPFDEQVNLLALENASPSVVQTLALLSPKSPKSPTSPATAATQPPRPRGRPPKNSCPLPDKLFAAYTARRLGAGEHNLPNGHNPKHVLSGGWPNPTALLAYERAFLQKGADDNGTTIIPISASRQAQHNADLIIYNNLPNTPTLTPEALQQSLQTISSYINQPSTAIPLAECIFPPGHPNHFNNHLTERTITLLVEAISRVQDSQT